MQSHYKRLAGERSHQGAGEPVRVDEVRITGRASQRPHHRGEDERGRPGPSLQVADEAGAVVPVDSEAAEVARLDHVDVDAARPHVHGEVVNEAACKIALVPWVRGRQDRYLQRLISP